jgi:tetratricopeptide (TPR) repeat protein
MILLLILLVGDVDAAARLAEIRARFTQRDKHESIADLERLAGDAPATEAGGQAAAWRGALAQQAGDLDAAAEWYQRALAAPPGAARRLGERGLGDLDVAARRYASAQRHFAEASLGAEGVLLEELSQKRQIAATLERRQWLEWAAWLVVALALGYFAARAWRGAGPLRPPLELIYVIPIYALLLAGGWGRDADVLRALEMGALGSTALIAAGGLSVRRNAPRGMLRWLQALLLLAGNLALFYAVVNRTGIYDKLVMSVRN